MSNILRVLKFLDKVCYQFLPTRAYRLLKRNAKKAFQQYRAVSSNRFLKIILQYVLPYRLYCWLQAKKSKKIFSNTSQDGTHNNVPVVSMNCSLREEIESTLFFSHQKVCRLVICCAFTGRYQVLAASIQESFHSQYASEIEWVLCGTTKEDALFIEAMRRSTNRVSGFVCANNPLGQKWQNCVSFAGKLYDAELYAIVGSDDIISAKLINYVIEKNAYHEANKQIVPVPVLYATINWLAMVTDRSNFASAQIFQCRIGPSDYFQPIGSGRFYQGSFIKRIQFQIFDINFERLLDDFGYHQVLKYNQPVQLYEIIEGALISVKGSWNQMNTVKDFFDATTLELTEFSFKGFDLIRGSCSPSTCDFLFKQGDLAKQLSFSPQELILV